MSVPIVLHELGQRKANAVIAQLRLACGRLYSKQEEHAAPKDFDKEVTELTDEAFSKVQLLTAVNAYSFYLLGNAGARENAEAKKFDQDSKKLLALVERLY